MKNIFEETYNKVQDAKSAYETATTETEQNAVRTIYKKVMENLDRLSGTELRIWRAYETAKNTSTCVRS